MNIVSLSGWLFADMLLVLAVVALGAMLASPDAVQAYVRSVRPSASPSAPSPSSSVSATPTPSPTKSQVLSLSKTPTSFTLRFSTSRLVSQDPATIAAVDKQIIRATTAFAQRRAGFVLTFGGDSNSGTATRIAEIVNARLIAVRPQLFHGSVMRDYINLSMSNAAEVQVFLYN